MGSNNKAVPFRRLPASVTPQRYAITLEADPNKITFKGEEVISLTLTVPAKEITLNSKDLIIRSAEIIDSVSTVFPAVISYDEDSETATFAFPKPLSRGDHRIKIVFEGTMNEGMVGFYRSSYTAGKKTHYIATTQFEATDARRAFPCFDEPAIKAVFEISLVIPKDKIAISNTIPVATHPRSDGRKTVTFASTPKMSTYLLAFIVGDFESVQKKTPEGVLVRVFVVPGKKHQAKFALDCAAKTLSFFARYFGIAYPLPVLDMIAIPDFASGAMENWGAITYREAAILFDADHSSASNQQWVALVVAHEIAHQWFGNLVTMEWWTHLWLNEGFASYIEYLAVDHIFPEWNIWDRFFSADMGRALQLDSLKHTHPIEVEVRHPGEISEIFDAVSYSKGASIIHMLADYLGEEVFRKGLKHYLKKHSYANTTTMHLWQSLQTVSGKPVVQMMKNWTGKKGYPLLTVTKDKKGLSVRQSRFFSNPRSKASEAKGGATIWTVPVRSLAAGAKSTELVLLDKNTARLGQVGRLPEGAWLKLNAGEVGFFRTNYPAELWRNFARPVFEKKLSLADRLGLMRDIAAIAEAGEISAVEVLEFARHYRNETEYVAWLEVAGALQKLDSLIASESFAAEYQKFVRNIFAEIASEAGWVPALRESHSERMLRSLALSQFGYYGDIGTVDYAKKLFAGIVPGKNKISPDLRGAVYNLAARYGGAKEYAKLMLLYKQEPLHEEKNRLGSALGRFRDKALLKQSLAFSVSTHVRIQDTPSIVGAVLANPTGRAEAWSFVKKNWKLLVKRYGDGHTLSRVVSLLGNFASEDEARDIERFFKANPVPLAAQRTLQQALEEIRGNAAWLARDRKVLKQWLGRQSDAS